MQNPLLAFLDQLAIPHRFSLWHDLDWSGGLPARDKPFRYTCDPPLIVCIPEIFLPHDCNVLSCVEFSNNSLPGDGARVPLYLVGDDVAKSTPGEAIVTKLHTLQHFNHAVRKLSYALERRSLSRSPALGHGALIIRHSALESRLIYSIYENN